MALYLISYDLHEKEWDSYERIINELERLGGKRVLFSQFLLRTDVPSTALRDHLCSGFIADDDRLIVAEILESNWATWRSITKFSAT